MKNWINRGFFVAALVACVALASAQDNGGQQRRGGGFGQRGFGQMGRGGQNGLSLAMRKDVQTDLALTEDQKKKLTDLNTKNREARRADGGGRRQRGQGGAGSAGGQTTVDREAMQKRMQEQREQQQKDLAAILTADQVKRLAEISLQLRGNDAILDEKVQKDLGITTEQKQKIEDLQKKQREANQGLMEKMRNNEIPQEDARKTLQANQKAFQEELGKVLTADQAGKLKTMQGKPFKADPNENIRRGGGGGGGR
jgi:hypothetical protein